MGLETLNLNDGNPIRESNFDCTVVFSHDQDLAGITMPIPAQIHLFEHRYDDQMGDFWYGVIEFVCHPEAIAPLKREPQAGSRVFITLWDCRVALARWTRLYADETYSPKFWRVRLVVVGITPLTDTS